MKNNYNKMEQISLLAILAQTLKFLDFQNVIHLKINQTWLHLVIIDKIQNSLKVCDY